MADVPVKYEARRLIKPDPDTGQGDTDMTSVPTSDTTSAGRARHESEKPSTDGTNYIEQLVSSASLPDLEDGVQVGLGLLEDLKSPLEKAQDAANTQAAQWRQLIQQLQGQAEPARTVVGVVGNTGAGKSSVINALLDEERLIPTNGMRACTASATEISYNYSNDPEKLYRAEIEFISAENWSQELRALLGDLIDGNGIVSRECNNPDSEAGLAYSKIKAVYPRRSKEDIANSDSSELSQELLVRSVLGTVKRLNSTTSGDLFEGLQHYVDSKEKKDRQMEYWPLIKVVKIFCKAPALSTGAVIVDLPGVQDSNAARAAVADSYMKTCTGLWITAAIQRAVDDKTAKNLLGESFKRQLKYDGTYSAVTFICTKTDDILESEVSSSLDIKGEVTEYWRQIETLNQTHKTLEVQIQHMESEKNDLEYQLDDLEQKFDSWDDLLVKLTTGETVYRPSEDSKKRKRKTDLGRQHKRQNAVDSLSDSDYLEDSDDANNKESDQSFDQKIPLTEEDIEEQLANMKTQKKELGKSKRNLKEKISKLKKDAAQASTDKAALQSEAKMLCIKGRNEYSRDAIKNDFAMGIKELNQESAIEEDEAAFDPDEDTQNYDEIVRSLPVFCVSARAYQKLAGRLQHDAVQIDGFLSQDDTEIPQLQEHAKKLTESVRLNTSQSFLNELNQLLNSMKLWAFDGTRLAVSNKYQEIDELFLRTRLVSLQKDLHKAVKDFQSSLRHTLRERLYSTFDRLIPAASDNAVATANGWGAAKSLGGLFWATYKATCRHDGDFSGRSGPRDFNAELFEPISRRLAGSWERAFQRRIPTAVEDFIRSCKQIVQAFHDDCIAGVKSAAANPAGLHTLNQQIRFHMVMLDTIPTSFRPEIAEKQRDANRGFIPVIQSAMQPAYDACMRERGRGTYVRMKSIMEAHVDIARNTMFRQACDAVKREVDAMCTAIEQLMMAHLGKLFTMLERDYLATLVGEDAEFLAAVPWAERKLRGEMRPILEEADSRFAELCVPVSASDVDHEDGAVGSEQAADNLIARQLEAESSNVEPVVKPEPL
ncbi:hypothetical protein N8I77_005867 [Diaporthe amygdali]|uniref:Nuclear GTPase SLIP-GC n=1 Tax=Phomopsis amygdali TaxID=1214568 RepID=A0AAD9W601_PHOAM|nr:hypothetical protein N8I77_005867 [Diaporthe amygdali]